MQFPCLILSKVKLHYEQPIRNRQKEKRDFAVSSKAKLLILS